MSSANSGEWLFVDTSGFIALYDRDDRYHEAACLFFTPENLRRLHLRPVTTDLVFSETYTYFRKDHEAALRIGNGIRSSRVLTYVRVSADDEKSAWEIAMQFQDKDFSFVDCTSFAVMKRLNCLKAFCFDKHFSQMGFSNLPGEV